MLRPCLLFLLLWASALSPVSGQFTSGDSYSDSVHFIPKVSMYSATGNKNVLNNALFKLGAAGTYIFPMGKFVQKKYELENPMQKPSVQTKWLRKFALTIDFSASFTPSSLFRLSLAPQEVGYLVNNKNLFVLYDNPFLNDVLEVSNNLQLNPGIMYRSRTDNLTLTFSPFARFSLFQLNFLSPTDQINELVGTISSRIDSLRNEIQNNDLLDPMDIDNEAIAREIGELTEIISEVSQVPGRTVNEVLEERTTSISKLTAGFSCGAVLDVNQSRLAVNYFYTRDFRKNNTTSGGIKRLTGVNLSQVDSAVISKLNNQLNPLDFQELPSRRGPLHQVVLRFSYPHNLPVQLFTQIDYRYVKVKKFEIDREGPTNESGSRNIKTIDSDYSTYSLSLGILLTLDKVKQKFADFINSCP